MSASLQVLVWRISPVPCSCTCMNVYTALSTHCGSNEQKNGTQWQRSDFTVNDGNDNIRRRNGRVFLRHMKNHHLWHRWHLNTIFNSTEGRWQPWSKHQKRLQSMKYAHTRNAWARSSEKSMSRNCQLCERFSSASTERRARESRCNSQLFFFFFLNDHAFCSEHSGVSPQPPPPPLPPTHPPTPPTRALFYLKILF